MSIAGHVSSKMLAHYSHIRPAAKRHALDALADRVVPNRSAEHSSYVTNHVTNAPSQGSGNPQVVEKDGRPVGTRTPDLYRVKVAL
jgi:hypothetical protein